jgi:ribosome-associated protein
MKITDDLMIDEGDMTFDYVRASGPGGQHVNKSATAVQLRYDVAHADLPAAVRKRLIRLAGNRMTNDGVLIIQSSQYRSQSRNREEARERFRDLVLRATRKPKKRRKTRPPRWSKRKRLENKRQHSEKKRLRERLKRY